MADLTLGAVESRFADIIWEAEPISTATLRIKSEETFGWKKSTVFTVLKRLCDKGIFINEGGTVRSLISKDEFYSVQSERFVEETFNGSLPAFLAAFTRGKKLSEKELSFIRRIIEEYEEA